MLSSSTVRVSKNGNAKTLTVPARVAEEAAVDVGDVFQVRTEGGDRIVFDRVAPGRIGRRIGRGGDRAFEIGPEGAVAAPRDTVHLRPVSWDF